ncbi:hypothetical protein F5J12DRAFT_791722 [Pisolithus orientalis]|uniref:uncharacterized protein n=1 Tax=Pisolithus orientalis TaxID=936130 RepID=UPI00222588D0|nr:uncharacterized protein F5J12DRAFT_850559 [Pisolithus orientalis]XP_051598134.1 uncharacterized protein F5J12DRAFT_844605 [Pisolithus orientalis]XP_051603921.1 uncharacterized protein F5J12DRAFT_715323 [Pisolithus orientalis]XP_051604515.1 uncharacterized protein F5J12DRAFT_713896 [Pisolithus orientalis]XP_051605651.1 uncharacterized protein F5J12DRAFT_791722 [Pisolithus orientalis]KAI5997821.1 hypothetical protein F5J12DRAFT_850559 [Pisolithus orientalis]KAI6001048.1 hypothetical protein 
MFAAQDSTGLPQTDGHSDEKPIIVPDQVSDLGFELFLSVCYNKWRPDTSQASETTLLQLLELSRMYESKDVREHAIKQLASRRYTIKPITLISIALKYHIKDIFCYAFRRLIPKPINELNHADYELLTVPVWMTLLRVKERLELHRRIVACEPPPMVHSPCCQDHKRCVDDWRQVWWNGMGRYLLDGRSPQPYNSAVKQFEGLSYGSVDPECWRVMLALVKEGKAFQHEDDLIYRTARGLAEYLIHEPFFGDDIDM